MKRLSRARLAALGLAALVSAACGGSDNPKPIGAPGAGGGADAAVEGGAGAGGEADAGSGAGGAGNGGQTADGGGHTPLVDTEPPTFNGAKSVDVTQGEDRVVVSWDPAKDPPNSPDLIVYRIYRAASAGKEDFTRAHRCGDAVPDASAEDAANAPCYVTTGTGVTSATVRGAVPTHEFFYVVRAVDASGNEDDNTAEISGTTPDQTSPDFGGVRSVGVVNATSIEVKWGAGYDLGTPDTQLSFHVFVQKGANPDPAADPAAYQSAPGERSTVISGLDPSTPYRVIVRAFDAAGHSDANLRILGVTTPEGVPPTFDGATTAVGESDTSIRLFWLPATDNDTPTASIVYDVYQSATKGGEKFQNPPVATSNPGASSVLITGLQKGTRYYFFVRARDFVGNQSAIPTPLVDKSATTTTPDTTLPTFNGVETVTSATPTTIKATWSVANDDRTLLASDFTYTVYVSTATPVPLSVPAATVRGVTSATLAGLTPATAYNVVVVASDAAGNLSASPVTLSGTTLAAIPPDIVAPTLGGNPTVTLLPQFPGNLGVSWGAATDDTYAATDIRYHVCASVTQTDCEGSTFARHVLATTNFGATTITLTGLVSHTSYFVYVRAEDRAGNLESANHFAQRSTATSWTLDVKKILFDRCVACHGPGSPYHSFDKPASFVNVGASYVDSTDIACGGLDAGSNGCQLKLVSPGFPEFSYLYRKINAAGLKTPPFTVATNAYSGSREPRDSSKPLTTEEDGTIVSWIQQGALGN